MIKVYTGNHSYKGTYIGQADSEFRSRALKDLDSYSFDLISEFDNSKVVNIEKGMLESPYGVIGKDNLSTGVKTLVLAYEAKLEGKPVLINVDECGKNIFPKLFEIVNDSCISIELNHGFVPINSGYSFMVNDTTHCKNSSDLMNLLVEVA